MSILLSANPPYAGWLVDGEKTIEWRKKPLPEGTAYIYETKKNGGCGIVIGEITIDGCYAKNPEFEIVHFSETVRGKVGLYNLREYAKGRDIFANTCCGAIRYDKPIPLSEFKRPCDRGGDCDDCERWGGYERGCIIITRPPQSWMYAERRTK